ncbi:hypothetical protein EG328_007354 [Venturia inaequalis]|uniref:Uncharacterized protein n=1 Tax=Venturia inaequalis TaxID=5025 RepID=A0A8H3UDN3_VENIN|nr:hypothetical protein EG328_007354 [Venturia inaequalis]KAE9991319.1 hypothetical protein EG327_000160 [Venturia inaequalis]RDI77624.1 hypothetical protein Vi05172_g12455 [Venturia inaequalis]
MSTTRYVSGLASRTCRNGQSTHIVIGCSPRQSFTTSIWLYSRAKKPGDVKTRKPPLKRDLSPPLQQSTETKIASVQKSEEVTQAAPEISRTTETSNTGLVTTRGPARRIAYPERLLIWNGGLWKNAFIGFTNVASLTWMGWGLVFWAPSYMMIPELSGWYTIPATLVSLIPFLYTRWTTSSYVATVRIELPSKARASKKALWEFAATLPPETTLEFTTVGPIGLQKRITTSLAELSPREPSIAFGIGNIVRAAEDGHRNRSAFETYKRWTQGSTLYVGGDEGSVNSNAPGIWHAVMDHIIESSARQRKRIPPTRTIIKVRKIK